jgi:hypothetical protein
MARIAPDPGAAGRATAGSARSASLGTGDAVAPPPHQPSHRIPNAESDLALSGVPLVDGQHLAYLLRQHQRYSTKVTAARSRWR